MKGRQPCDVDVNTRCECAHCGKSLKNPSALNMHESQCISRKHALQQEMSNAAASSSADTMGSSSMDFNATEPVIADDHNKELLRMLTRWRVLNVMKDVHVQQVKQDIPEIIQHVFTATQKALSARPHANLEDVYRTAADVLCNLQSSKAERGRAKAHYQPVSVHPRPLGTSYFEKPTAYGSKQVQISDIAVDVLVEDQIELLVCSSELAEEILKDRRSTDPDVIADVHDGNLYRKHPLFSWNERAMAFGLYGDDFGVHMPIGPRAGEHKVSLHYAVLYNFPKYLRYNINNLMLVTVVLTSDVKKYGPRLIISGSGDDTSFGGSMRRFADGLCLPKVNQLAGLQIDTLHYGALLNFFADSPFLALYLSRKEALGPSTYAICHHCTALNSNKHKCFSVTDPASPWKPITRQVLEDQRKNLKQARASSVTEFTRVSKETGLNDDQDAFEGIPWWDSSKAAYNDWFHGEPEGPVKDHEYLLIQHGIRVGMFTWKQFIQAMSRFAYYKEAAAFNPAKIFKPGFFTTGKPHKKLGKVLKLTGHQSLVLGLTLPAILWNLYDRTDPHWQCFCDHMTCVAWGYQDEFRR